MTPGCAIRGYVFDAYGTLFDVHSVVEAGRTITSDPMTLSTMWRQKQLEYTWLRALMGRYEDFWTITEAALRYTVRRLGLVAGDAEIARLMAAYLSLACFPEVARALERLDGRPRALLSNGSPRMLHAAVASAGLGRLLSRVLSVDAGCRPPRSCSSRRMPGTLRERRPSATRLPGAIVSELPPRNWASRPTTP